VNGCEGLLSTYMHKSALAATHYMFVRLFDCTWAQDEHPAKLHMAQPNVPVNKTGRIPPARLVCGALFVHSSGSELCC
jgi:hypothetical protein